MTQNEDATAQMRSARVAVKLRIHEDTKQRVDYWRRKRGYASDNEYMAEAVEEKIARENQDYDLPTLEQQRLNQLLDEIKGLSTNQANLEKIVLNMSQMIVGLARGDNYLEDDESGELAEFTGA